MFQIVRRRQADALLKEIRAEACRDKCSRLHVSNEALVQLVLPWNTLGGIRSGGSGNGCKGKKLKHN